MISFNKLLQLHKPCYRGCGQLATCICFRCKFPLVYTYQNYENCLTLGTVTAVITRKPSCRKGYVRQRCHLANRNSAIRSADPENPSLQEAQLLLGDRATRKPANDCWSGRGNVNLGWNDPHMYFMVIKSSTNRKLVYDFLLVLCSNFCRITHRLREIWCETV